MARLLLATGDRLGRIDDPRSSAEIAWSLEGSRAASLAVDPGDPDVAYVGRHANGVARTRDGGHAWEEVGDLPEPDVFSVAVSAADRAVYVGAEPALPQSRRR